MPTFKQIRVGPLLLAGLFAQSVYAQRTTEPDAKPARYPLRLHILAADDTHKTVRMQPNACSASVPDFGGGAGGEDSCSSGSGSLSFGGDDDFAGGGRADLVSPPTTTQGLSFSYEGCGRVRVPAGFQSLPARWKTPGKKLEVVIPTDELTRDDRPLPTQRCTFNVTLHEFVYLRLRNGRMVQVSQADYWKKPALRTFLSGGAQGLQERVPPVVTVKELKPAQPER